MSRGDAVRGWIRRLTGLHVHRTLPRGVDAFEDIARALPGFQAEVVFDVGANIGQSAREFLARFPRAHVHCFEPVSDTFQALVAHLRGEDRVTCHRLALGSSVARGTMLLEGTPDMFRLSDADSEPAAGTPATETVEISTVDAFARAAGIPRISFLKIDTEGRDLAVLEGAAGMLERQEVDLVQLEAGMNPGNRLHVPFEVLKGFLEARGYFLFGIYEQVPEWPTGEAHLRRGNPLFVSRQLLDRVRR